MLGQFCHETLAETHDLVVRLALRVEVRTALAAAHRQCGQAVLEDLLKAQELDNRCTNRRVQTQTALVRTNCRVELAAEATVYLYLAVVVYPRNTELDHTLRFYNTVDNAVGFIRRVLFYDRLQRHQDFAEFRLVAVTLYDAVVYALKISVLKCKCHGNLLLLDKKLNVAKHSVKNTGDPAAARGVLPANCPAKSRLCALVMIPYPHAVQTQNVCDACAFASNTCTRTSNNIYYTPFGYVFQCKFCRFLHFLHIEI